MADVFDVSKYILSRQGSMVPQKLEKLCYYAYVWQLVWTEEKLFSEQIIAWDHGPIIPELFDVHKGMFSIDQDSLCLGNADNLNADQKETVDIVLDKLKDWSALDLSNKTHEETPWIEAYKTENKIITDKAIIDFYGKYE